MYIYIWWYIYIYIFMYIHIYTEVCLGLDPAARWEDRWAKNCIRNYLISFGASYCCLRGDYSCCINTFIICVHYLCLIGRVDVFYVGHVDKNSLYEALLHCNIPSASEVIAVYTEHLTLWCICIYIYTYLYIYIYVYT
jgi:hypothetical protein